MSQLTQLTQLTQLYLTFPKNDLRNLIKESFEIHESSKVLLYEDIKNDELERLLKEAKKKDASISFGDALLGAGAIGAAGLGAYALGHDSDDIVTKSTDSVADLKSDTKNVVDNAKEAHNAAAAKEAAEKAAEDAKYKSITDALDRKNDEIWSNKSIFKSGQVPGPGATYQDIYKIDPDSGLKDFENDEYGKKVFKVNNAAAGTGKYPEIDSEKLYNKIAEFNKNHPSNMIYDFNDHAIDKNYMTSADMAHEYNTEVKKISSALENAERLDKGMDPTLKDQYIKNYVKNNPEFAKIFNHNHEVNPVTGDSDYNPQPTLKDIALYDLFKNDPKAEFFYNLSKGEHGDIDNLIKSPHSGTSHSSTGPSLWQNFKKFFLNKNSN